MNAAVQIVHPFFGPQLVSNRPMRTLNARDFLNVSIEEMLTMPDEKFVLVFDDGEVVTTTRRLIVSHAHWEVGRQYPKTPLLLHHFVGTGPVEPDVLLDILSNYTRDVHNTYGKDYDREELWLIIYRNVNVVYNTFIVHCEEYLTTSDITDYLEIYDHPEVVSANAEVVGNQNSLDDCYDRLTSTLHNAPELKYNPVIQAINASLVKVNQVCQIVGPRGYMTDLDSNIFETPILAGYFEGITSLHDAMIESRGAAKALTFTKKPLRQVEYFNRKMQLSSSNVHELIMGDCKTEQYATILMTKNLLKCAEGKYIIQDDGSLVAIRRNDTHLIDKTVKMRSALRCGYRGAAAVCSCCFGELAFSVPRYTNLGHLCSTEMCQEGSQLVLSVKHFDGSSKVIDIVISDSDARYIREGNRISTLALNKKLKGFSPYLLMVPSGKSIEGAEGLTNLAQVESVDQMQVHRTTSFREVIFGTTQEDGTNVEEYVTVSVGNRYGSLSKELLHHVQKVGYTITPTGMYHVDLSEWNFEKDAFILPMRHLNMLDAMSEIEVFIRSPRETNSDKRIGNTKKLADYNNLDDALTDLNELVSSKLSVNIAHLEVVMLSLLRNANDPHDYRIPDINEPAMFESHSVLMENRSMAAGMAYERQPQMFENPDSYMIHNRPAHILDAMIIDR
jgi:hypothetical protein